MLAARLDLVRAALGFGFVVLLAACGDASTTGYGTKALGDPTPTRGARDSGILDEENGGGLGGDGDNTVDAVETGDAGGGGAGTGTDPNDTDGDGVPNADDCDPNSKLLKKKIVQDDLATEKALFAAPNGFPAASWAFTNNAYQQTRLLDAADVSFFANDANIGDVQIEVTAASTEVGAITPRLRQIFVVVGATSNGGTLAAHACGIEVVGGEMPEQKTSIVKLDGTSAAMTTTVLQRVTRPAVQANEEFAVKVRLTNGVMICDVTQAGATLTTATAGGVSALKGSVGLFARQTKALFKNIRVCGL